MGKNFSAVFVSLALSWLFCELLLRLFTPSALEDVEYFSGFTGAPACFQKIKNAAGEDCHATNPRVELAPDTFAVRKAPNTYRIFVLGGSTTYGEPWGPAGAFARWLEERLDFQAVPRDYEVINCGHKGFGSFREKVIFEEIMRYDPDLIVIYSGVNEMREFTFHRMEIAIEKRPLLRRLKRMADHSHVFRLGFAASGKQKLASFGAQNVHEILIHSPRDLSVYKAKLDYARRIHRLLRAEGAPGADTAQLWQEMLSPWHPEMRRNFQRNLAEMAAQCRAQNVPLLLLTRARNFYGSPQFMARFEREDSANEVIRAVARAYGVPVVSSVEAIKRTMGPATGFQAFADEVHPTLACNQILAQAIADTLFLRGWLGLRGARPQSAEASYRIRERELASALRPNAGVLALRGWQALFENFERVHEPAVRNEIQSLARAALALNPRQVEAYFLLGALAHAESDTALAQQNWQALAEQFSALR